VDNTLAGEMAQLRREASRTDLSNFVCAICEEKDERARLFFMGWTDTHGVMQHRCGAPYRVLFYDGDKALFNMKPELLLKPEWLDFVKRYWTEHRRNVAPGAFSFGCRDGREREDARAWDEWCEANVPAELRNPPPEESSEAAK
jgi:hypothetical protein